MNDWTYVTDLVSTSPTDPTAPARRRGIHLTTPGVAALALLITAGSAGCVAAPDTGGEGAPEPTAEATGELTFFPSTCAQVATAAATPLDDGEYLLFVGADSTKPWVAYCLGMSGATPTEYLTLHRTGANGNYSQYTAGGSSLGVSALSSYTKVRIDPVHLSIDSSDQTFSTASGLVHHGGTNVTSMPYGVAMSCDNQPSGVGNIDLRGTPFAVSPNAFVLGGGSPQGGAVYVLNNQLVGLTGGGGCGYLQPSPGVFNPFNSAGETTLTLVHL